MFWIDNFLSKIEFNVTINNEEVEMITKMYELSTDIAAFQEDLEHRKLAITNKAEKQLEKIRAAMENFAREQNRRFFAMKKIIIIINCHGRIVRIIERG